MTDRQIAQQAIAKLKKTTISGQDYQQRLAAGSYVDPKVTLWWQALDLLESIGATEAWDGTVAAPGSTGKPTTASVNTSGIALSVQKSDGTYEDFDINGTGNSAVLLGTGGRFQHNIVLRRFRMRNVAGLNTVSYGKHGVYSDAYNVLMEDMDIDCSQYAENGISVRMGGTHVNRALISGAYFVFGFFDSDTGQSGSPQAECLIENVKGRSVKDTAIWCDAQTDFKKTFDMKLRFRNVHLEGPLSFLKVSSARTSQASFSFEGCTLNGAPINPAQVPTGSVIS